MGDLLDLESLRNRLEAIVPIKNLQLQAFGGKPVDIDEIFNLLKDVAIKLKDRIIDTTVFLRKAYKENKKILFEGAQGAMLCLNYGTFPYVTSSSPLVTAIPNNTGLPLTAVNQVLGIMKAYSTSIAIMLLDVLSAVEEIKIVTKYYVDGKEIDYVPSTVFELSKVKVETITLPSWKEDISNCKSFEELPINCQKYIETIEKLLECSIDIISVSPEKDATIIRKELF